MVVNPESFQHLPEYGDDGEAKSLGLSPLRRGSLATSMASSQGRDSGGDCVHQVDGGNHAREDPNVVILPRFEDATRRATSQWKETRSPSSPRLSINPSEMTTMPLAEGRLNFEGEQSLMQRAAEGGQDSNLLQHFRSHIWCQFAQIEYKNRAPASTRRSGVEVLEQAARHFPPVSLLHPTGVHNAHPLLDAVNAQS